MPMILWEPITVSSLEASVTPAVRLAGHFNWMAPVVTWMCRPVAVSMLEPTAVLRLKDGLILPMSRPNIRWWNINSMEFNREFTFGFPRAVRGLFLPILWMSTTERILLYRLRELYKPVSSSTLPLRMIRALELQIFIIMVQRL